MRKDEMDNTILINLFFYLRSNVAYIFGVVFLGLLISLVYSFFIVTPVYVRTVLVSLPECISSDKQINTFVEIIKADPENNDFCKASMVRNSNLLKLQFQGSNKEVLKENSDDVLENLVDRTNQLARKTEEMRFYQKEVANIKNELEYLNLSLNNQETSKGIEDIKDLLSENHLLLEAKIEADDKIADQPIKPNFKMNITLSVVVSLIFSITFFIVKYIWFER